VWRLVDSLVKSWSELGGGAGEPVLTRALETGLAQWWADRDGATERERIGQWRLHRQQSFLDHFDVSFRLRRLHFVIRQINQYQPEAELPPATVEALDTFKRRTYEFAERCFRLQRAEALDDSLRAQLKDAGGRRPLAGGAPRELLQRLARSLDLDALDRAYDAELAALLAGPLAAPVRDRLIEDYVGFPFFDVLLLGSGGDGDGPDPLTPIRVERISTADARALTGAFDGLRCRAMLGFLGFFNRAYREHDYLWGRLHGVDRLVDILADVAGDAMGDPQPFKQALFRAIVATERSRLPHCAADLDRIAEAIGGLDAN